MTFAKMYNDVQFRGYGALVMITDLGPEEKGGGGYVPSHQANQ